MNHDPAIPPRPTEGIQGESLPEHLAAKAGMPRTEGVEHSLHTASERATAAGRDANARLQQGLHDTTREATEQASNLRDRAADKAAELRDQAADKASELRDRASETLRSARARAEDTYDTQRQRAADLADRGAQRLHRSRTGTEDFIAENPLLVGVVGLAAGLLLGALLPRTRQEDRALGPYADDLRDQGVRYARDLTQRGRSFVETALDPENLDAAVQRAAGSAPERNDHDDAEQTAHRL